MSEQASLTRPAVPANLYGARVHSVTHYTDKLFAFTCERPAGLRFRSGEFVMIGLMVGEKPLLRAYSIASPAWDDLLAFYSIKAPDGPLTSRLQNIQPGDEILIGRKPTGTLVLDALLPGRRLFLLSTGTGIAPFASLIREPETYERYDEVILTHTCRTDRELDYGREVVVAALADPLVGEEARPKLRHVTTLTREPHPLSGRITTLIDSGELFHSLGVPAFDTDHDRVMICGSVPMLNDVKALALRAGFVEGANSEPGSFVIERAFAS
ncbi:MAG TPA: ferredoxin--NADP reductase [Vitreimonas sp.]|uniref:ferredoxin--NADP reductase n=1 Tax=Vitreimonas sp. TaxID=3069702 RepID=UPI002D397571|nr:ferredoxin--NADP reductase [Vitreimonas sp.]HYD86874.1 ferredoxin--NADP reductase [Vitreimonas sp.]